VAEDPFGQVQTVEVDQPIYKQEEADAIAKAILKERLMNFITGKRCSYGTPELKTGSKVVINVNDPRFNGDYYIVGVRHRYIQSSRGGESQGAMEGGYKTIIKVQRDAQSGSGGGLGGGLGGAGAEAEEVVWCGGGGEEDHSMRNA